MISQIAFVFPGQGAQSVGMGKDFADCYAESQAVFEEADQVLGYSLSDLIDNGPASELKKTYYTQPALLTTSIAYYRAFEKLQIRPEYVLGHSLGEYSALVAAGVLTFPDALRIVQARGKLMDEAVPYGEGVMAAVIGLDREELMRLCEEVSRDIGIVELANINASSQIVISGTYAGVQAAAVLAETRGAKRVMMLDVGGPFHSTLMKPVAEKLAQVLEQVTFQHAHIPIISNTSAVPMSDPDVIRESLIKQVYSPVLWADSVKFLLDRSVNTFYEIGPGNVLASLIKKIHRLATVYSINHPDALLASEV